jgi:hypothetical protein
MVQAAGLDLRKRDSAKASENHLKYLVAITSSPALMGLVSQQTKPPGRSNLDLRK